MACPWHQGAHRSFAGYPLPAAAYPSLAPDSQTQSVLYHHPVPTKRSLPPMPFAAADSAARQSDNAWHADPDQSEKA